MGGGGVGNHDIKFPLIICFECNAAVLTFWAEDGPSHKKSYWKCIHVEIQEILSAVHAEISVFIAILHGIATVVP